MRRVCGGLNASGLLENFSAAVPRFLESSCGFVFVDVEGVVSFRVSHAETHCRHVGFPGDLSPRSLVQVVHGCTRKRDGEAVCGELLRNLGLGREGLGHQLPGVRLREAN
eukprot:557073-Pyramimonas_sp.AAC.2